MGVVFVLCVLEMLEFILKLIVATLTFNEMWFISINLNKFVSFAHFALDFLKKPIMLLFCDLIQDIIFNLLKLSSCGLREWLD